MRPEIPHGLEQRIDQVYEEAGYATGSELVRDAVRRWIPQAEAIAETDEGVPRIDALLVFDQILGDDAPPRERTPMAVDLRTGGDGASIEWTEVKAESQARNRYDGDTRNEIEDALVEGATATLYVAPNSRNQTEYRVIPEISWRTRDVGGKWEIAQVPKVEVVERIDDK